MTLFNNTVLLVDLAVNESIITAFDSAAFQSAGTFKIDLMIDPYNTINEIYSLYDGSNRSDWDTDNSQQNYVTIILADGGGDGNNLIFIIFIILLSAISIALALWSFTLFKKVRSQGKRLTELEKLRKKN